jgi:hypothetical protein
MKIAMIWKYKIVLKIQRLHRPLKNNKNLHMKSKIRKIGDWKLLKSTREKHNLEVITINIAVILGVFVAAAMLQVN